MGPPWRQTHADICLRFHPYSKLLLAVLRVAITQHFQAFADDMYHAITALQPIAVLYYNDTQNLLPFSIGTFVTHLLTRVLVKKPSPHTKYSRAAMMISNSVACFLFLCLRVIPEGDIWENTIMMGYLGVYHLLYSTAGESVVVDIRHIYSLCEE
jgi:hypothetical protein